MTDQMVLEMINDRLTRIEDQLDALTAQRGHCLQHLEKIQQLERRADALESLAGKHAAVAATLGAIGAALALLVKYIVDAGGPK
jgi:archaellum component FlaC